MPDERPDGTARPKCTNAHVHGRAVVCWHYHAVREVEVWLARGKPGIQSDTALPDGDFALDVPLRCARWPEAVSMTSRISSFPPFPPIPPLR